MFIPLTLAIFRGVLSPSLLEKEHHIADRLLWTARQLKDVSGSLEVLTGRLREILSPWHVPLPLPAFNFLSSPSSFPDFSATAALCRLRAEEMEYAMSVSYGEQPCTPFFVFYQSVLRAEAHWLKLLLRDCIAKMPSDLDARLLLCEVLDEVYTTGVMVDEASRCGLSAALCAQLKGTLASLYLELSIDFGHLLQSADYMGYRTLLSDARYYSPVQERQALEYDILQAGNRVKRLFSADTLADKEAAALLLYDELIMLVAALEQWLPVHERLWEGVMALENYIFFTLSHQPLAENNLYSLLTDPAWVQQALMGLRDRQYSAHMQYNDGRRALHWILKKMNEPCVSFLKPLCTFGMSIPRRVQDYLLQQHHLYEENYASTFIPIQSEERLTMVAGSMGTNQPDAAEIHVLLTFLHEAQDAKGACLMTPQHAQWFEDEFLSFLQSGRIALTHYNEVKVLARHTGVVYGLIFHYHQRRGGNKENYARFLASVLAVDVQPGMLVSNYQRYIDTYTNYVHKMNLHLTS